MLLSNTLDYIRGFSRGYTACQRHGRQTVIIDLTSGGVGRCLVPRGVDLEIYVDGELWTHVAGPDGPAQHEVPGGGTVLGRVHSVGCGIEYLQADTGSASSKGPAPVRNLG